MCHRNLETKAKGVRAVLRQGSDSDGWEKLLLFGPEGSQKTTGTFFSFPAYSKQ